MAGARISDFWERGIHSARSLTTDGWCGIDSALRDHMAGHHIFITGGTGYVGRRLIPQLAGRGHNVRALVRRGSESKLPPDCDPRVGNALDPASFVGEIQPADTFVQLVGVSHPSPSKARQFCEVDLASVRASAAAAVKAGIDHFVYVSVAQPAPVMKEYVKARAEGEALLRATGMNATFLRPWYILGPGHRWPCLIAPGYWIAELFPSTRSFAQRLGLITLRQMIDALVYAVENPPAGIRILEVPQIRRIDLAPVIQ